MIIRDGVLEQTAATQTGPPMLRLVFHLVTPIDECSSVGSSLEDIVGEENGGERHSTRTR